VGRLQYLLSQGCKEGLVRSPRDWPGASSTEALLTGRSVEGRWFDRTAEFLARRRGQRPGKYEFSEREQLELAPLPCWASHAAERREARVAELVREIERTTRAQLAAAGRAPMGARRLLAQDPHAAPAVCRRSPAPRFHAASRAVRKRLELAYACFLLAYRRAADALRRGLEAQFPPGSFPPALPFRPPLGASLAL
jgi:hypothetical protein